MGDGMDEYDAESLRGPSRALVDGDDDDAGDVPGRTWPAWRERADAGTYVMRV
ncbi:hypothetical protein IscW_ISCW002569 [Ixodes scapularis]|uniref:Uncharacterized protein n=1 Tax=Ixodes scapularis TaxID=6945 RepID=B7P7P9_IXOSC|nr:hypothetical protein IscW_ISCW002569 [Ixodes scapularis]|eukprot:XP_002399449.1 hypothetical protein IscW_ISCW002569 [Ixodes scapularis]